jgi:hypothetical protein
MKLPRHRRIAIRETLAELMRAVEPTPFAAEGPCRAGVRSRLCLDGWSWVQADAEAALLVMSALQQVGAKRPSWKEGQPEWTQDGYAPHTRERCVRCCRPLPEGNFRYCGPVCARAAEADRDRRHYQKDGAIVRKAQRIAWSARQPVRSCEVCSKEFRPNHKGQKLCSRACVTDKIRTASKRNVRMVCEGL